MTELLRAQADAHVLRAENAQLRFALAKKQADIDSLTLTAERQALEASYRAEMRPPDGHVFDWSSLTFLPPTKEPRERD